MVDYLVKPINLNRFAKAVKKALDIKQNTQPKAQSPTSSSDSVSAGQDSFFVNVEYPLFGFTAPIIPILKDYIKIFLITSKKSVLTKSTLKGIVSKLPDKGFVRVDKSYIVNLSRIESIRSRQIYIHEPEIPVRGTVLENLLDAINHSR